MSSIEASLKMKPAAHRKADRIVQFFIPGVVFYAFAVFVFSGGLAGEAAADVGIAIGHGKADLAVRSSDIIMLRDDPASLLTIMRTGRRLIRVIRQNYTWAIAFNLTGIALATFGILSPWMAGLLHHASSVLVVANSARLARPPEM